MKRLLSTALVILLGLSAAAAEEDDPAAAAGDAATVRQSYLTTYTERGESLAAREEVLWFDWQGEQRWMAVQPARTEVRGSMLLLAEEGASANGHGHLAALRRALPAHGWQTYFTNLPDAEGIAALLSAARGRVQAAETLLVVCEGEACKRLVGIDPGGVSGIVYVNVPWLPQGLVSAELAASWSNLPAPALILQEHPYRWPEELPVAQGTELQLLPVGHAARDSLVQRKLRGWLKRRLQAG